MRLRLRALLATGQTVAAPGAFDPLSAMQVARAGFEVAYLGSYAMSCSVGVPDVGILTLTEMCDRIAAVADVIDVPLVADAEEGFYEAPSIGRAIRALERTGVSAVHIEDHVSGKHTGVARRVLPAGEMIAKIGAALDARSDPALMVIARTDSLWAGASVSETVDRLAGYAQAGADAVMPSGMSAAQLGAVRTQVPGMVVLINDGNQSVADERAAGANLIVYHALCLQAAHLAIGEMLERFRQEPDIAALKMNLCDAGAFESLVDYAGLRRRGESFRTA